MNVWIAAACAMTLMACEEKKPPAPVSTATPSGQAAAPVAQAPAAAGDAAAEAKAMFAQRCVLCHGASGKGDGVTAASINPKPRNYTDAAWQASVTDADLRKIIVEGGDAVGKSMMMPPNPDLKDKPAVVDELVKIVRSFGKK